MRTRISQIGAEVSAFQEDKILILFGEKAPEGLEDYAIIHKVQAEEHHEKKEPPFKPAKTIRLGEKEYKIIQVGTLANDQFLKIGHVCFYFSDQEEEMKDLLPGAVQLYPQDLPRLRVGDVLDL